MHIKGRSLDRMERIEELVQQFESAADPSLRAAVSELIQLLMNLHGAGMGRMLDVIRNTGAAGSDIIQRFGRDDLIAQLLMLHDLHPVNLESRVKQALDKVRPLLKSHGGDVELLDMDAGQVRVRLNSSCHTCPSSVQTLRSALEEALYESAPDIAGLEVVSVLEEKAPPRLIQLELARVR